jgi:hypothetical protein
MSGVSRVRWAAIGAAVAVSLGAGGIGIVNATISSGPKAVYVPITPCRLADTRPGDDNVGTRSAPLTTRDVHTFTVRGTNGDCTIPTGASAIVANVTAVAPSAGSFMTIWPADKPQPLASSLNYTAGQAPTPNAVTVALSADGKIKAYNHNGNVHVIIDITGYYQDHTHDDRYYTQTQTDEKIAAIPAGPKGDKGDRGDVGPTGPQGPKDGASGQDAARPARIVWVAASGGDFTSVQAALDSITDASPANRYLVRIAPGVYEGKVVLKNGVDLEGSGQGVTVLSSIGSSSDTDAATLVGSGDIGTEVRNLTVANTCVPCTSTSVRYSTGIFLSAASSSVRLRDVTVTAGGANITANGILVLDGGSPVLDRVTTQADGGGTAAANGISVSLASPTLTNVHATALNSGSFSTFGINLFSATSAMSDVTATAIGGNTARGVNAAFSTVSMTGVTASASGGATSNTGLRNAGSGSQFTVRESRLSASGSSSLSIANASSASARVAGSLLEGPVANTATIVCVNTYSGSAGTFTELGPTCS